MKFHSLRTVIFTAFFTGLLSGCSTVKLDHPASLEEYSGELESGTARLAGEAFGMTKGGVVKYAAGRVVHLDPVTSYSTELFEKLRRHGSFQEHLEKDTVEVDPLMLHYRRNTLASSIGRFRFVNLPAGDYYVSSYVSWMIPNGTWTGSWLVRRVKLAEGETKNIIVR